MSTYRSDILDISLSQRAICYRQYYIRVFIYMILLGHYRRLQKFQPLGWPPWGDMSFDFQEQNCKIQMPPYVPEIAVKLVATYIYIKVLFPLHLDWLYCRFQICWPQHFFCDICDFESHRTIDNISALSLSLLHIFTIWLCGDDHKAYLWRQVVMEKFSSVQFFTLNLQTPNGTIHSVQ